MSSANSPVRSPNFEDTVHRITQSQNVAGHYISTNGTSYDLLSLFIDLQKRVDKSSIAVCNDGKIGSLPITLTLNVTPMTVVTDKSLANLKSYTGSHNIGKNTRWSVEGDLLRLDIDMSEYPAKVAAGEPGTRVLLENTNGKVERFCLVFLNIKGEAQAPWTLSRSPSRLGTDSVSRQLNMSGASPQGSPALSPSPAKGEWALRPDLEGEFAKMGDALAIDTQRPTETKILFYPKSYHGNLFSTNINLYTEIAVYLRVQVLDEERQRRRQGSLAPPKNVRLSETHDKDRNEPALVISFNAETVLGLVESDPLIADITNSTGAQLVANCTRYCLGRYIVDMTASRAAATLPTEKDVYDVVAKVLDTNNSTSLDDIDMDEVRQIVADTFYTFTQVATLEMKQQLQTRVWACARLYVVHTLLCLPPPVLDDVREIIASI